MTPSELEGVLTFESIRRVIALEFVLRVVEQHANIASPFNIRKSQNSATSH